MFDNTQAEEVQQTSNSINIRNSAIVMDSDYVFIYEFWCIV